MALVGVCDRVTDVPGSDGLLSNRVPPPPVLIDPLCSVLMAFPLR
ncbi:hypothetical protein KPATCC21470_0599 [Kitasatospora purpeofusca]